jgi:hypothetical protein
MINDGINDVPDKTIAIFMKEKAEKINRKTIEKILQKPSKKRDWFTSNFYRCLPLTIGNQYGFTISSEFDIKFIWSGGDNPNDIGFQFFENEDELKFKYPYIFSNFGSGVITIDPPFTLRTPPGVNLMTINPPNVIIPNITVMTGVVEADNIRRNFTFNLKIQIPNVEVFIPKGTPLAGFIPIPRYYADSFNLKFAEDIFLENIIIEENQACIDAGIKRHEIDAKTKSGAGRDYFVGRDIYGNLFKDHQAP